MDVLVSLVSYSHGDDIGHSQAGKKTEEPVEARVRHIEVIANNK